MEDKFLDDLCDSLAHLCDIPESSPGALYGLKNPSKDTCYSTVSELYTAVVKNVEEGLKSKGVFPEYELIQGFDNEQHFQQVALVSSEASSVFIPQIAFSETQLTNVQFPICEEGEVVNEKLDRDDDRIDESAEDEASSEDELNVEKSKKRADRAVSDSELEDEDLDDESDDEDGLFGEDNPEEDAESENSRLSGEGLEDENWDEVEAADTTKVEGPLSSYERSRKKMNEEIRKMEEKQLQEKPWQMKGELDASVRPVNSLLEEVLEYDMTQRPAPVITEEVTLRLEDVILKRIKDKAFDDVTRKIKPVDAPLELKKKIVLDQEKSKLSLAEVYEQEFLKQKSKVKAQVEGAVPTSALPTSELTAEEKDINSRLARLFAQLDVLSNLHFTPPPRLAEVEVVSNMPAVTVEEVGQDALTSANLLAPGEVAGKLKRDITASSEKTKTDKKRERRKKKVHQAKKFKKLQLATTIKTAAPTPGKGKIKMADPALKSSTSFFTQLETTAKKHIDSNKRQAEENKKSTLKAKKLKL
uniref:U3 small nucleolar ribonucleoprotein protein MPP10 n=1 Tax=Lygus hesperus TaxID=30085 RepID=A0A0K8T5B9_LYGHE